MADNINIENLPFNCMADDTLVKVVVTPLGIMATSYYPRQNGAPIKRLPGDEYVDMNTGEVKKMQKSENRAENMASMLSSFRRLWALICCNVTYENSLLVTLTYAENMQDPKKLGEDFERFERRLKRKLGQHKYIAVPEPQGRGAWHFHVFLIFDGQAPEVSEEEIKRAWGMGNICLQEIPDVLGAAMHYTMHARDISIEGLPAAGVVDSLEELLEAEADEKSIREEYIYPEDGPSIALQYKKYARLPLYPPGFHIIRASRGLKQPLVGCMTVKGLKESAQNLDMTLEHASTTYIENGKFKRSYGHWTYQLEN